MAASSMSCGFRTPSPSPSTPMDRQVPGMNCIGPTARSNAPSPSNEPASLSLIRAVPDEPSSRGPKMPGTATPSEFSALPPKRPWLDSTRPIAATSVHGR
jgi:hypothetical protein